MSRAIRDWNRQSPNRNPRPMRQARLRRIDDDDDDNNTNTAPFRYPHCFLRFPRVASVAIVLAQHGLIRPPPTQRPQTYAKTDWSARYCAHTKLTFACDTAMRARAWVVAIVHACENFVCFSKSIPKHVARTQTHENHDERLLCCRTIRPHNSAPSRLFIYDIYKKKPSTKSKIHNTPTPTLSQHSTAGAKSSTRYLALVVVALVTGPTDRCPKTEGQVKVSLLRFSLRAIHSRAHALLESGWLKKKDPQ